MSDDMRWIRSYLVYEPDGKLGTIRIYEASSPEKIREHALRVARPEAAIASGDTIVEYTGGSTGPALAFVCGAKGYRTLIVIADCFTEERFQLMRALGAELDVVKSVEGRPRVTPQDIRNMVERAAE